VSPLSRLRKPHNKDVRPREYLTETEVESLMDAATSQGRHGHRDATMILNFPYDDLNLYPNGFLAHPRLCTKSVPQRCFLYAKWNFLASKSP